ncbi:TPA: hypothetical protein ACKE3D_002359 [Burkholderia dolosa]
MSDLMLLGILRMPADSIVGDFARIMQFVSAARGAADRIEADAKLIAELRAALEAREADRRDAERYRWAIALEDNAETLYAAVISCGPRCTESINIEIDAARAPASEGEQK